MDLHLDVGQGGLVNALLSDVRAYERAALMELPLRRVAGKASCFGNKKPR